MPRGARASRARGKAPASSAPLVAPNDPSIVAGIAEFPGEGVRLDGYLARPAGTGRHAIVLVCHDNRGLTRHVEDVARRVAKAGYVGLARDLLSRRGWNCEARVRRDSRDPRQGASARHVQDFKSGPRVCEIAALGARRPGRNDRVLLRRAVTWRVAAGVPDLRAAVALLRCSVQEPDVPGNRCGGARDLRRARRPHQPEHSGDRGGDGQARQDLPQDRLSERGPRLPQRYRRALQRRRGEGRVGEALSWFGKYLA